MKSKQVPRLVVALVEPEAEALQPSGEGRFFTKDEAREAYQRSLEAPPSDLDVVEPEARILERRQLVAPKKVSLLPMSQTPTEYTKRTRFGVILESLDERILTTVTRDILSMVASMAPGERLVVCPATSGDLWERLANQMPIDIQYGGFEGVPTWKTYWIHKKPTPPKGVHPNLEERVVNPNVRQLRLRPGGYVPMPTNRDDSWVAPLNQNPSFRRMPTMAPVQMTPQLYLWSSRAPASGEKVLVPDTEEVMTIASIEGSVAKVGPNHVAIDMRGYEFFQPLDLWASRSFMKERNET